MELPDAKALKELADACRKAGITSFKGGGFEFTLGDKPEPTKRKRKSTVYNSQTVNDQEFQTDSLTEEQLLMWSAVDPSQENSAEETQ